MMKAEGRIKKAETKQKYPAEVVRMIAKEILACLEPLCVPGRCCLAGSLRRERDLVGDAEILFVPRRELAPAQDDLFGVPTDLAANVIKGMCEVKFLEPRRNELGRTTWGELIKLARHTATGVPIDFFTATPENWWNYLVCRTGPKESNEAICKAARARGWKWEPYSSGFVDVADANHRAVMESERAVFEFVGLKYVQPRER